MEIFGAAGQKSHVTMADMSKMKYLEACIKEALRLYPSVPMIGRVATDNVEIDGHMVEKGELISLHIGKLHRNPKVWNKPNDFIPERFLKKGYVEFYLHCKVLLAMMSESDNES